MATPIIMAVKPPINLSPRTLYLPSKPTAKLSYTYLPGSAQSNALLIFLNGLIMPQSSWYECMQLIYQDPSFVQSTRPQSTGPQYTGPQPQPRQQQRPRPHILSYDRYGQGLSDNHPTSLHDILDSVNDLHSLLTTFQETILGGKKPKNLIFICNSIGCALARLYAATFPSTTSGFIFLDSVMTDTDFVTLFPDPDAPSFDAGDLPAGTTVEQLRSIREVYRARFHPDVPNPEGLDRSTLRALLPRADGPELEGEPWVLVVGHEWEKFAEENEKSFNVPKALIMQYVNPPWQRYNEGLATLTSKEKSIGPIIAVGCGHFIQRDDPNFVAERVCEMVTRIEE